MDQLHNNSVASNTVRHSLLLKIASFFFLFFCFFVFALHGPRRKRWKLSLQQKQKGRTCSFTEATAGVL